MNTTEESPAESLRVSLVDRFIEQMVSYKRNSKKQWDTYKTAVYLEARVASNKKS